MKRFYCALAVLAVAYCVATAQSSITVVPIITDADIINAAVLVDPLAEKIKDIAPTAFSLQYINNTGKPVMVSLAVDGWVTLEEDRTREQIVTAHTIKPFLIPEEGRRFTSKDAQDAADLKSDIIWDDHVNETLKNKLKDKVLDPASGGRVPSGLYEIHIVVTVDSVNGNAVSELPIVIDRSVNVTNPTTAVLDVPFNNGYVYPTPFPQFQWTYDTRAVMLSVYEKRPEHQSLEDAISASDPFLQVKIDRRASGNLTTFTYPQTPFSRPGVEFIRGPRQLERGKMYVVVLDGISTAFGFEVDPLRTIRSFVISDPRGQATMNLLMTSFGGGQFQDILNVIQDLNLLLNTDGITLNGVKITPQDLQKLLTDNKDRITSIRFEE